MDRAGLPAGIDLLDCQLRKTRRHRRATSLADCRRIAIYGGVALMRPRPDAAIADRCTGIARRGSSRHDGAHHGADQ